MDEKVEKLLKKYKESDKNIIRASIVDELSRINHISSVKALLEMLKDEDILVRAHVVSAITNIGKIAIPLLIKELYNPDKFVRRNVVRILGGIKTTDSVEPLLRLLLFDEKEREVNLEIITALGKIGDERAVLPLLEMLKVDDWEIQWNTINALGRISSPTAVEALLCFLNNKNEDLVWAALMAIEEIKGKSDKPVIDKIEDLKKELLSKDELLEIYVDDNESKPEITVTLKGNLFARNVRQFEENIIPLIQNNKNIVLNFKDCNFIDSFALGSLIRIKKQLDRNNLKIKIVSCPVEIKNIFISAGLIHLFDVS